MNTIIIFWCLRYNLLNKYNRFSKCKSDMCSATNNVFRESSWEFYYFSIKWKTQQCQVYNVGTIKKGRTALHITYWLKCEPFLHVCLRLYLMLVCRPIYYNYKYIDGLYTSAKTYISCDLCVNLTPVVQIGHLLHCASFFGGNSQKVGFP